jgi:hypothetical protein
VREPTGFLNKSIDIAGRFAELKRGKTGKPLFLPYFPIKHEFRRGFVLSARSGKRVSNPEKAGTPGVRQRQQLAGKDRGLQ